MMHDNDNDTHWTASRWFVELSTLAVIMAGIWCVMNFVGWLVGAP